MEKRTEAGTKVLGWVKALQQDRDIETNSRRIFKVCFGPIRGFLVGRLHDGDRAEELVQETFLQAFQRIRSFRHDGSFEAWLFAIAANLVRNEWRRRSQQKRKADEISLDDIDTEDPDVANSGDSPERESAARERLRAVMTAIELLPEKQQNCIRLYLAGHDYGDIGELLKIAASTARVHVHAARKRLREQFPDADDWLG